MKNTNSINIFLLCFMSMIGLWFIYHGIFAAKHYDLNNNLMGKFPVPNRISSLAGDFAYPWNGAKNFIASDAGIYFIPKCYLPTEKQCFHYSSTPFVPLTFSGFTKFPYFTAYRVYLLMLLTLWGVGIYTLSKMYTFNSSHTALLLGIILLSCPFHNEFERGNWHSLIFLSVLFSFYLQNWKNDVIIAAFFVTFAMFLKIHPALFIAYFFIKGHFRTTAYACLFSICFFFLSGGPDVYKIYYHIVKAYTAIMANSSGGWHDHSTSSMLSTFIDFGENSKLKQLISFTICGSLMIGIFIYIFIMGKKFNTLLLKIEFSLILILANITPSTASRYSLIYIPFIILTLIEILDHEAIKAKFSKYWTCSVWIIALLACYTLMAPFARVSGEFNIILKLFNPILLTAVRHLWFTVMILFFLLIYFHWQISKSDSELKPANPFRNWYDTDLSLLVASIKKLTRSFQASELLNLLDPVKDRYAISIVLTRACALLLFVYLIYYSSVGSNVRM